MGVSLMTPSRESRQRFLEEVQRIIQFSEGRTLYMVVLCDSVMSRIQTLTCALTHTHSHQYQRGSYVDQSDFC